MDVYEEVDEIIDWFHWGPDPAKSRHHSCESPIAFHSPSSVMMVMVIQEVQLVEIL